MRGKKAKALRRRAESVTVGQSNVHYQRDKKTGVITLLYSCTRAVYQKLKQAA